MSDFVIYTDQSRLNSQLPATHAIVIGVGEYFYLPGGSREPKTEFHGGLRQLSSPPESAKAITDWLLDEFHNPDKPLATVSLLVSEKSGEYVYSHPKLRKAVTTRPATFENVKNAVRQWKNFGDRSEKNLILFFFCGHGVAKGLSGMTLLLSDYGESDDMPMEGAIDFEALHRGMAQCGASEQCYFIDACRMVSTIATETTTSGQTIIQDNQNRSFDSDWKTATFYSTLAGEAAYGRKGKPSFYTEALINGLRGMGSNNRNGDGVWRISTNDLSVAIHQGLATQGEKVKIPTSHLVYFEFHELRNDPLALAIVYCDPKDNNSRATFYCRQNQNEVNQRSPAEKSWEIIVPYGRYDFIAEIGNQRKQKVEELIMPPYREIKIEV
ncbi:MAG TPA: caspase family protein [Pyrinomonadaceae bacterium]|jgi:hypothetical protein